MTTCPKCQGSNSHELGGNDRCFHCSDCGYVQCVDAPHNPGNQSAAKGTQEGAGKIVNVCGCTELPHRMQCEYFKAEPSTPQTTELPDWENELFKFVWVTDGKLLCNPEKIADIVERIRNEGRDSVLYVRCMKHRGGPQYNKDEHGQECTECAIQDFLTREREKDAEIEKSALLRTIVEKERDFQVDELLKVVRKLTESEAHLAALQVSHDRLLDVVKEAPPTGHDPYEDAGCPGCQRRNAIAAAEKLTGRKG